MLDISDAGIASIPPSVATRAAISAAAQNIARLKNVPLADDELPRFVDLLIAEMGLAHILFASIDPALVDARSQIINRQLDILATARLLDLVAVIEGKQSIYDPVVQAVTGEIMSAFEQTADTSNICWPETSEMMDAHYTGKLRGPTVTTKEDGTTVTCWWKCFDLHRDPADGPARIETRGSYRREEYWYEGKRHRPWQDGPADIVTEMIEGKHHRVEAYWFEGLRHRPHTEGPARIVAHYNDNTNLSGEEYYEHGKRHRPSDIGPAATDRDMSGRVTLCEFYEEGELHRDPKIGPASMIIRDAITLKGTSDDVTTIRYCVGGDSHRDEEDGPAVKVFDNRTGLVLQESYDCHGKGRRKNGPAILERNAAEQVVFAAWCDGSGWFSRDPSEGPAVIRQDPETGITTEEFMFGGQIVSGHSPPAMIKRDRDGNIIEQFSWDGIDYCPLVCASDKEASSDG